VVIRRARADGCRVILNLAPAVLLEAAALRLVDLLVVNEDEAQTLADDQGCGATAAALHAALGVGVIRTLGADGAEVATDDGVFSVASPVVTVVDTTAAGDCFVGVLAAALDRGLSLRVAMRRACIAAGLACTVAGSQRSLPDAAGIDAAGG
jgi:ribokinase